MMSAQNNELLTRVGPGTPMGRLLRSYWIPALRSSELAEPGGPAVRVRLLGEPLVAFRDSEGRVGLLAEHCPHRQASLFFGRNEQGGLRCVYHGWKFDVTGRCIDLPSEPPGSRMRDRVKAPAYRCGERGGVIWAYLGDEEPPPLPELEWALVPDDNRYLSNRLLECNWAQALEGDIDSSHASFLHSMLDPVDYDRLDGRQELLYFHRDRYPRYEVADTEYGLMMAARRNADALRHHWRAAQWIMPFHVMIAPFDDQLFHTNIWVPMDDTTTMVWVINWHPDRALSAAERAHRDSNRFFHCTEFDPPTEEAGGAWRPRANAANGYRLDRELQKTKMFFGVAPLWCQDKAGQESMGPIVDRTREHLAPGDLAIVRWRQRVLETAREFTGEVHAPARDPATHHVRPIGTLLGRDSDALNDLRRLSAIR